MSLISRILEHSRNARVPRALDPETHEPIPYGTDQSALVKMGVWILKTSWVERAILKWITALSGTMTAWLAAKGAGDNTPVIVGGVVATLTFGYEQLASYLNSKATMKIPPRVGGQSLAPVTQSTSTSDSGSTRSEMFRSIIAKPTSLADDEAALLEFRSSLRPLNPEPTMPTAAEQEATRAKLYGYSVEVLDCDSRTTEVHDFADKFTAIQYRNVCRAEGKVANLL